MIAASLLILLALYLNKDDKNTLALVLLVGASYFLPVHLITDRGTWYATVIIAELIVLLSAVTLKTKASLMVIVACVMLELNHINGYLFNGHNPESPYQVVVKYIEYIEISALILFSSPVINKLKGLLCPVLKRWFGF